MLGRTDQKINKFQGLIGRFIDEMTAPKSRKFIFEFEFWINLSLNQGLEFLVSWRILFLLSCATYSATLDLLGAGDRARTPLFSLHCLRRCANSHGVSNDFLNTFWIQKWNKFSDFYYKSVKYCRNTGTGSVFLGITRLQFQFWYGCNQQCKDM